MEGMRIASLHKQASQVLIELVRFCDENQAHLDFVELVERDHALLIALTRAIVDERKAAAVVTEVPSGT